MPLANPAKKMYNEQANGSLIKIFHANCGKTILLAILD